jgi:hypothetical protein
MIGGHPDVSNGWQILLDLRVFVRPVVSTVIQIR